MAKSDEALCTIIIPTLATDQRKIQLLRAVQSVLAASSYTTKILVCANGRRWHQNTLDSIREISGVSVIQLDEPSLPKAIAYGRSQVVSPFFGFLDDDDYLLPNSLNTRIEYLRANHEVDVVVTNGIRKDDQGEKVALDNLANITADPMGALFMENWLPSCGGLFRSSSIGQNYFDDYHGYAEWTWLAYQLTMNGKNIAAIEQSGFVINDTPGSLSKSIEFQSAYLKLYERMLALNPPQRIKFMIDGRISAQLHDLSHQALNRGQIGESMKFHIRSLFYHRGFNYLPYTRHILRAALIKSNKT